MSVKPLSVNFIECNERVPGRARLDLLARNVELNLPVGPFDRLDRVRGDQHVLSEPPVASIDDKVMEAPVLIVEQEVLDMTDFAVDRANMVSHHFHDALQMVVFLPSGDIILR